MAADVERGRAAVPLFRVACITASPGVPGLAAVVFGSCGSAVCDGWRRPFGLCGWFSLRPCRRLGIGVVEDGVGELGAGALVEPGFEDVEVAGGDQERDEERLGYLARCRPVLWVTDVDLVALEAAVDALVVRADGLVGGDPVVGQVVAVLPELGGLEVAGGVGGDGDVGFAADAGQFVRWWWVEPFVLGELDGGSCGGVSRWLAWGSCAW
ncbi:hypothetical protein G3I77_14525 [Streptomyces sp. D2-8]|uniref:hypothetical protein n=1 Tax=Streptomyces sp. D2-8 TaxID=2707767 RepID=UPI0020BDBCEA|nr:hypothetical protein [Streptomyces sp. D2-8]MCK8434197.1 hypothetical protein [Streptomyces sp. D2-8]